MTRPSPYHLSPDALDAWLEGRLPEREQEHLASCPLCQEVARLEGEVVRRLAALPMLAPSAGFSDRVMAQVQLPDPFRVRAATRTLRSLRTRPRLAALAASLLVGVVASVAWTLTNRPVLDAIGQWFLAQGADLLWTTLRQGASSVIAQPWYATLRDLVGSPARASVALGALAGSWLVGLLALRRLTALPAPAVRVADVRA